MRRWRLFRQLVVVGGLLSAAVFVIGPVIGSLARQASPAAWLAGARQRVAQLNRRIEVIEQAARAATPQLAQQQRELEALVRQAIKAEQDRGAPAAQAQRLALKEPKVVQAYQALRQDLLAAMIKQDPAVEGLLRQLVQAEQDLTPARQRATR